MKTKEEESVKEGREMWSEEQASCGEGDRDASPDKEGKSLGDAGKL